MDPIAYVNGSFVPLSDAKISVLDRGFLFADGIYEVSAVLDGKLVDNASHLARLERSVGEIQLKLPETVERITELQKELIARNKVENGLVYLQVTRGAERTRNHLFPTGVTPTVFAYSAPFPVPSPETLTRGLAASVLEDTRWARCDIKSIALLANVLLRQQAADAGAAEALLVRDGWLMEGSLSSVFVCSHGRLVTPPNSRAILPGTTRDAVLDFVDWLDEDVRPIARAELDAADEVWIGSAGRGVLPVTSIDGRPVGDGKPGPHWRRAHATWQRQLDEIAATPPL